MTKVIRTICLNPAVDRTVGIEGFALDAVNRVGDSRLDAGGKGINVSKAVLALGGRSVAYGFLAGAAGDFIRSRLDAWGIPARFVRVEGETRTNLKVVDPVNHTHTDINEPGPSVGDDDLERMEELLFADAVRGDVFVFSGSLPRGADPGTYASWIRRARSLGALALLDADGEALRLGVAAGPDLAKPNRKELESFLGVRLDDPGAAVRAVRSLVDGGVSRVALSLGADGAIFADAHRVLRAPGLPIRARSTVGAGDSMLAAIAMGLEEGRSLEDLVAPAVAAGTAAAATEGSQAPGAEAVAAFLPLVRIETIWKEG